jgi:hypothetical protein
MSDHSAGVPGMLLRMAVPATGDLMAIVADVAAKVADFLGQKGLDRAALAGSIDAVAAKVAPRDATAEITFEFRESGGGLLIEARCGNQTSEVRCPLPA